MNRNKLEKKYYALLEQYEEKYDDSLCNSCDKYNKGQVNFYTERLKNCDNCCPTGKVLMNLAQQLDATVNEMETAD